MLAPVGNGPVFDQNESSNEQNVSLSLSQDEGDSSAGVLRFKEEDSSAAELTIK